MPFLRGYEILAISGRDYLRGFGDAEAHTCFRCRRPECPCLVRGPAFYRSQVGCQSEGSRFPRPPASPPEFPVSWWKFTNPAPCDGSPNHTKFAVRTRLIPRLRRESASLMCREAACSPRAAVLGSKLRPRGKWLNEPRPLTASADAGRATSLRRLVWSISWLAVHGNQAWRLPSACPASRHSGGPNT